MATQKFLSDLWSRYGLTYPNVAVFQSHPPTSTVRASTTLTPQASNPDISLGDSVDGYRAPVQLIQVYPPMLPPKYREQNEMNPLQTKETNLALEKISPPDPRKNITGTHITTPKRLENMDIQTTPFNYPAIIGIVGILVSVAIVVWLSRRGK
tara:strand:+ start:693 stop:1151 length:459 start_codon:yes stop_codon:yes gene_type:complete